MKNNEKISFLRTFNQAISLFLILLNVFIILNSFYNIAILQLERNLMKNCYITHCDKNILCNYINIVILLFSNCGLTTDHPIFNIIFVKIARFYSLFLFLFCIYILTLYKLDLCSKIGFIARNSCSFSGILITLYGTINLGTASLIFRDDIVFLIKRTCFVHFLSILVFIFLILSHNYLAYTEETQEKVVTPSINSYKFGLNTESLRNTKIIL